MSSLIQMTIACRSGAREGIKPRIGRRSLADHDGLGGERRERDVGLVPRDGRRGDQLGTEPADELQRQA